MIKRLKLSSENDSFQDIEEVQAVDVFEGIKSVTLTQGKATDILSKRVEQRYGTNVAMFLREQRLLPALRCGAPMLGDAVALENSVREIGNSIGLAIREAGAMPLGDVRLCNGVLRQLSCDVLSEQHRRILTREQQAEMLVSRIRETHGQDVVGRLNLDGLKKLTPGDWFYDFEDILEEVIKIKEDIEAAKKEIKGRNDATLKREFLPVLQKRLELAGVRWELAQQHLSKVMETQPIFRQLNASETRVQYQLASCRKFMQAWQSATSEVKGLAGDFEDQFALLCSELGIEYSLPPRGNRSDEAALTWLTNQLAETCGSLNVANTVRDKVIGPALDAGQPPYGIEGINEAVRKIKKGILIAKNEQRERRS